MEKQVWKFEIGVADFLEIDIPKGAEILTVQIQDGLSFMWVLVNPKAETEKRTFRVFGTGHSIYCDIGINYKYIGTFQLREGGLVYHLFEYLGV